MIFGGRLIARRHAPPRLRPPVTPSFAVTHCNTEPSRRRQPIIPVGRHGLVPLHPRQQRRHGLPPVVTARNEQRDCPAQDGETADPRFPAIGPWHRLSRLIEFQDERRRQCPVASTAVRTPVLAQPPAPRPRPLRDLATLPGFPCGVGFIVHAIMESPEIASHKHPFAA